MHVQLSANRVGNELPNMVGRSVMLCTVVSVMSDWYMVPSMLLSHIGFYCCSSLLRVGGVYDWSKRGTSSTL